MRPESLAHPYGFKEEATAMGRGISGCRRERRWDTPKQFVLEQLQCLVIVHVIPDWKFYEFYSGTSDRGHCLGVDRRSAPVNTCERFRMRRLHADEVVAAIARAAEHDAVARTIQFLNRMTECVSRQGRRVGVDKANCAEATGQDVFCCGQQPFSKTVTALRDEFEADRKQTIKEAFVADRRIRDEAGSVAGGCDIGDISGRVAQEADVQGGSLFGGQRR